jgi:hypothetical protein
VLVDDLLLLRHRILRHTLRHIRHPPHPVYLCCALLKLPEVLVFVYLNFNLLLLNFKEQLISELKLCFKLLQVELVFIEFAGFVAIFVGQHYAMHLLLLRLYHLHLHRLRLIILHVDPLILPPHHCAVPHHQGPIILQCHYYLPVLLLISENFAFEF